jgi:putative GTP pyrophosphokinase
VETKVEIQIRTIAMDFWASLEHKIYYKFEGNAPEHIRKELKECSEIVSYLDQKMLSLNDEIKGFTGIQTEELEEEISYKSIVAESFGTIVEEGEPDEDRKEQQEPVKGTDSKRSGRKRVFFGLGL